MSERIIIVEDDGELRDLIVHLLNTRGFQAVPCRDASSAMRALMTDGADLVITDLMLPGIKGDELVREVRKVHPELNVIVITAFGTIESAIALIRAGTFEYITKPFTNDYLLDTVRRALAESQGRRSLAETARQPGSPLEELVGQSSSILSVIQFVGRAAGSRHPVLITGESGTGKELIARAIHRLSGRTSFVPVNCGALPESIAESELFGHEKGAFTGADRSRAGLFEAADNGTIFLDEIGELPLNMQPKLLRVLEQGEIRRVGSTEARHANFRLISASNRLLEDEIAAGNFREDLFWRINVLHVHLPPLRNRPEDIPLLVERFIDEARRDDRDAPRPRLTEAATRLLCTYPWPGNARELRNAVQRALVMTASREITPDDLPPRIRDRNWIDTELRSGAPAQLALRDVERQYILEVLRQEGGNRSKAAAVLGLDRKTLYRKLKEYESEGLPEGAIEDTNVS